MKIYNHLAYECTASELNARYERCTKCRNFSHTCMYWLEEADTTDGYENVAWCTKEGRQNNEKIS